jgi:hypothetical protein
MRNNSFLKSNEMAEARNNAERRAKTQLPNSADE